MVITYGQITHWGDIENRRGNGERTCLESHCETGSVASDGCAAVKGR
jgi:hypothetical protein